MADPTTPPLTTIPPGRELPATARAVIVGGGVAGASVAFHLARLGWSEIVLLERASLATGTTFYSAGVVGQLRADTASTQRMQAAVELYRRLATETGVDPGWHEVGSLRLASTPDRLEELDRQVAHARLAGLPMERLDANEARGRFPLISADRILGAAFIPTDGWIEPANLTLAYVRGAQRCGATIVERTRVTGLDTHDGRITGVRTERGRIATDVVVDAAGYGAADLAATAGVTLPIVTLEHQYLLTAPIAGASPTLPVLRDPDALLYVRPETGGLLVGGWEHDPAPWGNDGIPPDFNARVLPPDWPRFEPLLEGAVARLPALAETGVVQLLNGVDAYTPDGRYLLGPTEVEGLYVAAAFCSQGVSLSGVNGELLARWIHDGEPPIDMWPTDPRRFGPAARSRAWRTARTVETVGHYFALRYPHDEHASGRPLRHSPVHARLADLGASFGERDGWERPNWVETNAPAGDPELRPAGLAGRNWSTAIVAEALAVRHQAGLFDISSFGKLEVSGPGALACLQTTCANDIDRPAGSIIYTQALDRRGGIQLDLTVTRLEPDRFLVVTGATYARHARLWLERAVRDHDASVRDVSGSLAALGIWGPAARQILAAVCEDEVSNDGFPMLAARTIRVAAAPVLALRVTNVGEQGWELYVSPEFGLTAWDALWAAGQPHGLRACGYRALDSLRIEKGYRARGAELTPADDPYEAGLGFTVALDKPGGFVGRDAVLERRTRVTRRLRSLALEQGPWLPLGGEPVLVDGAIVGSITSAAYGAALGHPVALAWVASEQAADGQPVDVDLGPCRLRGQVSRRGLYDPEDLRVRS